MQRFQLINAFLILLTLETGPGSFFRLFVILRLPTKRTRIGFVVPLPQRCGRGFGCRRPARAESRSVRVSRGQAGAGEETMTHFIAIKQRGRQAAAGAGWRERNLPSVLSVTKENKREACSNFSASTLSLLIRRAPPKRQIIIRSFCGSEDPGPLLFQASQLKIAALLNILWRRPSLQFTFPYFIVPSPPPINIAVNASSCKHDSR